MLETESVVHVGRVPTKEVSMFDENDKADRLTRMLILYAKMRILTVLDECRYSHTVTEQQFVQVWGLGPEAITALEELEAEVLSSTLKFQVI